MNCSTPGLPAHHQLPEFTQTHVHRVRDAIQPSHPLSSPSPPAPNPSQRQSLFQWVSSSHEVPKYWSFSFSISPSNEHPGLISFRIGWLDHMETQKTSQPKQSWERRMELEESTFLTSDYTAKLQSSRKYGIGTKTEIYTKGTIWKTQR